MTEVPKGSTVRVTVNFRDSTGTSVDPTAVSFKYRAPGASTTTVSPTKDSTGHYHYDLAASTDGQWFYRYEGTGTNAAAGEGSFQVTPSVF